jgi:glycosyltransferase involved in cell wall biosynthesis
MTDGEPKLSVLVTCFNHERYIPTALKSVLEQQVSCPFEVVVCDDGSADRSQVAIRQIADRDPDRFRLLLAESNLGHAGCEIFMRGLGMCRGRYIAVLDGDDFWTEPGKLQTQADFLDANPDCALCFHNAEVRYEDGSRKSWNLYTAPLAAKLSLGDILDTPSIQDSTLMFRREAVRDFEDWRERTGPDGPTDWAMALVAACRGPVGYIDRTMAVYLQHGAGAWSAVDTARQLERVIRQYGQFDRFLGGRYRERIEKAVCVRHYEAAIARERQGDLSSARQHLTACLSGRPEWLETYAAAFGLRSGQFRIRLSLRLWLYRIPRLFRLACWVAPRWTRLEFRCMRALLALGRVLRWWAARGSLSASPNPALESARHPGLGVTTLTWRASGTSAVEVRVGTPDGPLLGMSSAQGTKTTGEWVRDGMLFYLQNVSGGLPLTLDNTLDVIRVSVQEPRN